MVEVILLSICIILLVLNLYSLFITNKNIIGVETKLDTHIQSSSDIEEANQKIRKWTADALKKISEKL